MTALVGLGMILMVVFVAAVVVGLVMLQQRLLAKHQAQMLAWTQAAGWQYTPQMPELAQRWRGTPFVGGRSAKARDVITGTTPGGREFVSFQYEYVVSTGKSSSTVYHWIIAVRLPAVLPELALNAESFATKLVEVFGGQDIKLESEDFNKAYRVQSPDQAAAYGVLHPRMMEWLLGEGRALTPWRITAGDLVAYRYGKPAYEYLLPRLNLLDALVDQIPRYLWSDYARGALPGPH